MPSIYLRILIWSGWGGGIFNNRYADTNQHFNSKTISTLSPYCQLEYPNGVSATPVVDGNGTAYYPTWNGLFVAMNYTTCQVKWTSNITSFILGYAAVTPEAALMLPVSRTSPQINDKNGVVLIGTLRFGLVLALDMHSGKVLGSIPVNAHPVAAITMSPTFYNGTLFIGASSSEEVAAASIAGYKCCSFVRNVVALTFSHRAREFHTKWNISMIPASMAGVDNWSGAAIWGSQPSIDSSKGQVFIGTGNTYAVPLEYQNCQNQTKNNATADSCLPREIWQDSLLAIDIATGSVNWVRQVEPLDAWTIACGLPGAPQTSPNCPQIPGTDADFGIAPTFVRGGGRTPTPNGEDIIVAGQKNGNLYAMSARTGETLWATVTGPGLNNDKKSWQLQPSNRTINGSANASSESVAGQLVVKLGVLEVLDIRTGQILLEVVVDAPSHGGFAVQDGYLLFGTGYQGYNRTGSLYVMKVVR
ncbi:Quino protein alcohol dehydrogenase-like protein [Melanomma pulvis-pyrius CBS 109.77]|uniref:Quino protein alcohol dehydrogenase-like protein n=1 Tax=Melanomma pulvis-pyrius CBS 109.77 TaxID=1314802 RepID=A0A6A6WY84_9PLEO|nr:Quino protein alcohol dehydrogenase-like protein [Melanomma pulvis-pyrius CBS 109.77]